MRPKTLLRSLTLLFASVAAAVTIGLWIGALPLNRAGYIQPVPPAPIVHKITVIHFTAPWCGPCQGQHQRYEEIRHHHNHCEFRDCQMPSNGEGTPESRELKVHSIPTYVVFVDGEEYCRTMMVDEMGEWVEKLEKAYNPR